MNKITADHLARRACVYIRQSTPDQVRHNLESQRRQYALVDRARALGWQDVDVIDADLGVSGSGTHRPRPLEETPDARPRVESSGLTRSPKTPASAGVFSFRR